MPDSSVESKHLKPRDRVLVTCAAAALGISLAAFLAIWLRELPAFGYATGVLALVFGAYAAGWAIYHWHGDPSHFFNVVVSAISMAAGLVLLTITVIRPEIHPLVFAISALVSLAVVSWLYWRLFLREAAGEIQEGFAELKALSPDEVAELMTEEEEDSEPDTGPPGILVGSALWLVCIPVTIVWAVSNSREVAPILLALPTDQATGEAGLFAQLPDFGDPTIALAWGSFYGVAGAIGLTFMLLMQARPNEVPYLIIDANGLVFGYWITTALTWLLDSDTAAGIAPAMGLAFGYVIVLHYGIKVLESAIPQRGFGDKYTGLLGGVEGLLAGWLLSTALGSSAAIYTGLAFVSSMFVARAVAEWLFKGWLAPIARTIAPVRLAEQFASARANPRMFAFEVALGGLWPLVVIPLMPVMREALRISSP